MHPDSNQPGPGDVAQADGYTVVARRYRPKSFAELIGQDHIAQALEKAISAGRVGHAYLFTGARGVGKTSTARIFAKSLNTPEGMDSEVAADLAKSIDSGDDMDVIEIDGASNRGIEEIRQLRANVNVRPSRSPFKIYIIDEVHMLTSPAFNALLKTLEEPPAHVKFIFCTTDPDKIPITVLSRCQRFDFTPVKFEAIQSRLKEISQSEGFEADDDALALLARRAAGSMRDSQSLLEQVMSFANDRITLEQVHALLGTADEGCLLELVKAIKDGNALEAIRLVDQSSRRGAEAGQLAEQLLNYLRDIMAVGVGGGPEIMKLANPHGHDQLSKLASEWGTQTILSAIQILDESLMRMRTSVSSVTLLEVALVQICQLECLASIPELLERVSQSADAPSRTVRHDEKKKVETSPPSPTEPSANDLSSIPAPPIEPGTGEPGTGGTTKSEAAPASTPKAESPAVALSERPPEHSSSDTLALWKSAVGKIDGMLADFALLAQAIEPQGADKWKVLFPPGATKPAEYCQQSERKSLLQKTVESHLGRTISLDFTVMPGTARQPVAAKPQASVRAQMMREMSEHPYVKKLCEVIDGEIVRVDMTRNPAVQPSSAPQTKPEQTKLEQTKLDQTKPEQTNSEHTKSSV